MSSDIASEASPAGLSGHAFSSLFQAVTGLRNRRAIVAMLGCTFVGVIVAGLLLAMSGTLGFLAGLLAMIVWIVAIGTGVNAAGLLQMDHARGISPRSTADALVYGLMCIPKLIVLGLAFLAVEIAVFIVLAMLLFICKIPFLGPLLFVVVFPLSVVVAGVTIVGLFICMVLSLPAIWQGASITRALAQTFAIVKSRLVEAVLLLVFVGFLCFAVAMIIFGVLGFGLLPTLGMSVSIVGFGGFGMESIMAMSQGGGGEGTPSPARSAGAALGGRGVAGRPGLPARPVARVPARHRRARPHRVGSGAARDLRRRQAAHRRARREGAPGSAAGRRGRGRSDRRGRRWRDGAGRGCGTSAGLQPAPVVQPAAGVHASAGTGLGFVRCCRRRRSDDRAGAARPGDRRSRHRAALRRACRARRRRAVVRGAAGLGSATRGSAGRRDKPAPRGAAAGSDDVPAMPVAGDAGRRLLRRLRLPFEVAKPARGQLIASDPGAWSAGAMKSSPTSTGSKR